VNRPLSSLPAWRFLPKPGGREQALTEWRGWNWAAEEKALRNSEQGVAEVMPRVLSVLRMERRLGEAEILKVWNSQMDPVVAAHAQPTGLRNGTAFVSVDSSVWLDEIVRYRRREILERLQNSFGREMVARISFRTR
jgi:predicted nucleic acid-binding Zn ribbon protein